MNRSGLSPLERGLNVIPVGVCFCRGGRTVFINAKMKSIIEAAFVSGADDVSALRVMDEANLKNGCRAVKNENGEFLLLPDGSAWSVKTGKITADGEVCDEYAAYDVTELYNKSLELKKRNGHIAATNEKIRQYSKSMDAIIRDRELLDAKIRIHDDVGRALLSLRSYLYREDKDRESLINLWRITVSMLRRETIPDASGDMMEALAEASSAVDVKLNTEGIIPENPVIREISAAAIRECLTNTVKHADGHNLYIKTSLEDGVYAIKIKNDGRPPDKPIEETGGLHTLRKAVERYGGEMTVSQDGGFELTIRLDYYGKDQK